MISLPAMGDAILPLVVALATGLLSCLTTRALIPILRRREVLDHPNERSSHIVPVPRGGGIAVVGSVLLTWVALAEAGRVSLSIIMISLAAGLLAVVSWIDDLCGLSPAMRLPVQGVAVAIGILALPETHNLLQSWLDPAVYFLLAGLLWIWSVNLFNFMDGIDGLASSEAVAIGGGLLLFAGIGDGGDAETALLAAGITGAAVGFLVWNWAPARIILGDVGSTPLGYLLGFLLLALAVRGHWKIALILPLYFLADATITLARRMLRGERIWQAHREHYYQRAVRSGLGHVAVVKRVIVADVLLIGCGLAAETGWGAVSLGASVVIVAILLATLARGGQGFRRSRPTPISDPLERILRE